MSTRAKFRAGVTLLELLVVIFIIMLLMAAATRVLRPAMENSQGREGARILSTMLGTARNIAMQTRRSAGVMFLPNKLNASGTVDLVYVQVPPPYAGDALDSRIQITAPPTVHGTNSAWRVYTVNITGSPTWRTQVSVPGTEATATPTPIPGLTLQFNYQGNIFKVETIAAATNTSATLTLSCPTATRWPGVTGTGGLAFQFFRGPKPDHRKPVTLPAGAVVDLKASGIADGTFAPNLTQPVTITFLPSGQVDKVYYPAKPEGEKVSQNVFFLVGRITGAGNSENLADKRAMWVSVVAQSGQVGTDKNKGGTDVNSATERKTARGWAATATNLGG